MSTNFYQILQRSSQLMLFICLFGANLLSCWFRLLSLQSFIFIIISLHFRMIDSLILFLSFILFDDLTIELASEWIFFIYLCYNIYCSPCIIISFHSQQKLWRLRQKPDSYHAYYCQKTSENLNWDPVFANEPIVDHGINCNKAIIQLKNCSYKSLSVQRQKFLHV